MRTKTTTHVNQETAITRSIDTRLRVAATLLSILGIISPLSVQGQTVSLQGGGTCNLVGGMAPHISELKWSGDCVGVDFTANGPGVLRMKVSPAGQVPWYLNTSGTMVHGQRNGIWVIFRGPLPDKLEKGSITVWKLGNPEIQLGSNERLAMDLSTLDASLREAYLRGTPKFGPVSTWGPSLTPDQAME